MSLRGTPDLVILLATLILVAFGLTMMLCASADCWQSADAAHSNAQARQFQRVLVGLVALLAAYSMKPKWMFRLAVPGVVVAAGLVIATLTSAGHTPDGQVASRWLFFERLRVGLQPSEILKLMLIVYLARMLSRKDERIATWQGVVAPVLAVLTLAGLVAAEPSFGMAISIAMIGLGLIFAAGARLRHLAVATGIAVAGALQLIMLVPYARERLLTYLRGDAGDPLGQSYQLKQSLIALGSGGVFGRGFGDSLQKFEFLPASHTDFIFSIVGEEGGFLVTVLILSVYALIVVRALRVSVSLADPFQSLLAAGVALMISVQVVLNIAVVTGLAPTTGLPLPFLSYGGSSLVVHLAAIGVLLRMSAGQPRERVA
jgi:cell division protein FtsW